MDDSSGAAQRTPPLSVGLVVTWMLNRRHFTTDWNAALKTTQRIALESNLQNARRWSESITSPAVYSSKTLAARGLLGTVFGDDTRARRVRGRIWRRLDLIWAITRSWRSITRQPQRSAGAQRAAGQRVRGVQMVDNNSYMLNTFPPVLSLKCAARLNFNSLSSLWLCLWREVLTWFSFSWRRPLKKKKKRSYAVSHLVFQAASVILNQSGKRSLF